MLTLHVARINQSGLVSDDDADGIVGGQREMESGQGQLISYGWHVPPGLTCRQLPAVMVFRDVSMASRMKPAPVPEHHKDKDDDGLGFLPGLGLAVKVGQ